MIQRSLFTVMILILNVFSALQEHDGSPFRAYAYTVVFEIQQM